MKVKGQDFERDGRGSVTLIAEESEDLWHLYNLVAVGDAVRATTHRKVQRDEGTGTETKKLKLTIEVKNVEYDAAGDAIRFSGAVCEESEWVKMGAHHTIEIELNELITVRKENWDAMFLQQLEDATNIAKSAEVATVLMEAKDVGNCNVHLLTEVRAKRVANVQHALPRKRVTSTQLDKAMEKFFEAVYEAVKKHVDVGIVKCVVLGGPGAPKKDFGEWMQRRAMQQGDTEIVQKKGIFLTVETQSIHNQGLEEILRDEQVKRRITNTRAAVHIKALEEFQKREANGSDLVTYGKKEVLQALSMGAVDTMMISDALFRNVSVQLRKEYVKLVADVREAGSTAHVFSSAHVTGQKLAQYADLAALLRFPVDYDIAEEEAAPVEATPEQPSAPSAPPKQALARTTTAERKPVVSALAMALGEKVSEARIEAALAAAAGRAEDAYLALLLQELTGTGKEPAAPAPAAPAFGAGDTVEVLEDFKSGNKVPGELSKGLQGKVAKIDGAGDAYVDFGEPLKKHWVKARNFHLLRRVEAEAAPKPKAAAAAPKAATAAAAKPKAAAAKPAAAKPKAKGKSRAALQFDDYDYY